jgi:uncharacterized membrane protein
MDNHLRGLSLLYYLLSFTGIVFTLLEAPYIFIKLFAVAYGTYLAFELLNYYQNEY